MASESIPNKRGLKDLELIRIAEYDADAFTILATERLQSIKTMLKDWCNKQDLNKYFDEIAEATIYTAVEYARHLSPETTEFEPPDWFERIAVIVLYTWTETRLNSTTSPISQSLSPSVIREKISAERREEVVRIRRHFQKLRMKSHRDILELVMISDLSPEEAGQKLGFRDGDLITQAIYRAALEELLCLIKLDTLNNSNNLLLEDADRVRRCISKLDDQSQNIILFMFNHSLEPEAIADSLEIDEEGLPTLLYQALQDLMGHLIDDFRETWRSISRH